MIIKWNLCVEAAALNDSIQSGEDAAFGLEVEEETNFMSILLTNLQINYEAWRAELPEEERKEEEEAKEDENSAEDKTEEDKTKEAVKGAEGAIKMDEKDIQGEVWVIFWYGR
jgi:hypothetical protein